MSRKTVKKWLILLVSVLSVLSLVTAVTATEQWYKAGYVEQTPFRTDLDGDGTDETVAILDIETEDEGSFVGIEVKKGEKSVRARTEIVTQEALFLGDIDGDGLPELILSGDECSDDYITYCWRYTEGKLVPVPFEAGEVLSAGVFGVENGVMHTFTTVNALGTYTGYRDVYYDAGVLVYDGDCWQIRSEEYTPMLVLKQDIYVLAGDADEADFGEEATLSEGTVVYLTATDGETFVRFVTEGGTRGTILLEEDDWGSHTFVNGMNEEDVFEGIEYAD